MKNQLTRDGAGPRVESGRTCNFLALVLLATVVALGGLVSTTTATPKKYTIHDEMFSVSFASELEGWACGDWGTVLHTRDGARTWEPQISGTESTLGSIFFVNPLTGWAVGNGGTIIHTTDGGQQWEIQESPVPFFHGDVFFVSPLKGWIASEMTHILYTEDGGKSWRVQFEDDIYNLAAISFSDGQHGWAVGEYGFTYRTDDGGKSWVHQAGYLRVNDETGDLDTGVTLFDVIALDAETGIAVGADGVATMTKDAGATWSRVKADIPSALFFGAATDGMGTIVIGGKGAYLFSSDKGNTWEEIPMIPPMTYNWLYGFEGVGAGRFVAVGEEGAIYSGQFPAPWTRVDY